MKSLIIPILLGAYFVLFFVLWLAIIFSIKITRDGSKGKGKAEHLKQSLAIAIEFALSLILPTVIFKIGLVYFKISVPYVGVLSFIKNLFLLIVSSFALAGLLDSKVKKTVEDNKGYQIMTMLIILITGFITAVGS